MTKDYWKQLYFRKKQEAIDKLGGKCVDCGSKEKLEFDHIDPSIKCFTITAFIRQNVDKELEKCQLLCKSCHRNKSGRTTHGKRRMYNNGCRCEKCVLVNRNYFQHYKRIVRQEVSRLPAK